MNIVQDNKHNQATNAWKMIYILMDNVKTYMNETVKSKNKSVNSITNQDVDNIIDYIYDSIQNITKNPNVNEGKRTITQKELDNIINECANECFRKYLNKNVKVVLNEGAKLVDVYDKFYSNKIPQQLFYQISQLDPTATKDQKGKYLAMIYLLARHSVTPHYHFVTNHSFT